MDRLDPELLRTTRVVDAGDVTQIGDMTKLSGAPQPNTFRSFEMRREGVRVKPFGRSVGKGKLGVAGTTATTTGAPLYEPPTLFIADSFSGTAAPQFEPFFADRTVVSINSAARQPAELAELLLTHKTVVFESVERAIATGRLPLLTDPALDALEAEVDRQLAARH
jgi:hypothetical protein